MSAKLGASFQGLGMKSIFCHDKRSGTGCNEVHSTGMLLDFCLNKQQGIPFVPGNGDCSAAQEMTCRR